LIKETLSDSINADAEKNRLDKKSHFIEIDKRRDEIAMAILPHVIPVISTANMAEGERRKLG
jgi:hypothetical protein